MTTYTITEQQMHHVLDAIDFVCREGDRELPETTLVEVLTMLSNLQPNTQEPLTDEQIFEIGNEADADRHVSDWYGMLNRFARAIEAAHNIKG